MRDDLDWILETYGSVPEYYRSQTEETYDDYIRSEKLNAQAEIERAKGAAEAIRIENGSITPTYIQYLWVRQQNLASDNKVIYIPTEAGLPILEAGRSSNE